MKASNREKGLKIVREMANYELNPPFTVERSDMFSKMTAEIMHEAFGILLRHPYFELMKQRLNIHPNY